MSNRAKLSREKRINDFQEKVFKALKILEERIDVLQSDVEGIKEVLDETNERSDKSRRPQGSESAGTNGSGSEDVSESGGGDVSEAEVENNASVSAAGGIDAEYRG